MSVIFPSGLKSIRTAAKGVYKLEPALAGSEGVICVPDHTEFSHDRCKQLAGVGYHVCNYCTTQWERFKNPGTLVARNQPSQGRDTCGETLGRSPQCT
jgi:hypothetical protein